MKAKNVGLDLDQVCIDFIGGFYSWFGKEYNGEDIFYKDPFINENFWKIKDNDAFTYSLKPLTIPQQWNFKPAAYITARPFTQHIATEAWLFEHGFPSAPVLFTRNKREAMHKYEIDLFVDDKLEDVIKYDHYLKFKGGKCLLMDAAHNRSLDDRRIMKENNIERVFDLYDL